MIKEWFKKNTKLKIILLIVAVIIIFVVIITVKLNTLVGEQLRLTMTPSYAEIKTISPSTVKFDTTITTQNKFICKASCVYSLTDVSENKTIDTNSLILKGRVSQHYSKELNINYFGYGQKIYLYRLECYNEPTALCPALSDVLIKKSLLVVSYSPNPEQLNALKYLNSTYKNITQNYVASIMLLSDSSILQNSVNLSLNKDAYYVLSDELRNLNNSILELLNLWGTEDYISTQAFEKNNRILERSADILSRSKTYNDYLRQRIAEHNAILTELQNMDYDLELYKNISKLNENLTLLNSSEYDLMRNVFENYNIISTILADEKYDVVTVQVILSNLRSDSAKLKDIISTNARASINSNYISSYSYAQLLCSNNISSYTSHMTYMTPFCKSGVPNNLYVDNITVLNTTSSYNRTIQVCDLASAISSTILANSNTNSTDSISVLISQYDALKKYDLMVLKDYNTTGISAVSGMSNGLNASKIHEKILFYQEHITAILRDKYNITNMTNLFNSIYTINGLSSINDSDNNNTFDNTEINDSEYLTFSRDNILFLDILTLNNVCHISSKHSLPKMISLPARINILSEPINLNDLDMLMRENIYSKKYVIQTPISKEKCCVYGECNACDKEYVNKRNPLILLHGHSVNMGIDASRSVEIFDGLESKFSNDKKYFLSGMLVKDDKVTSSILGKYYLSAITKPTYYIETYNNVIGMEVAQSKNDNVDTYALRLKDSIDYTLYLTGSDKVDVVAHSMGGLVVRRYMQVFGTDKIGTVILVGTPNNGVSDTTYVLCKLFGSTSECDNMLAQGLFIKKLNDPTDQPSFDNMYLVIGKGCDTEGVDGDGVVTAQSSLIKNFPEDHVLYVLRGNRECSTTHIFHQELLRPELYPDVYTFIDEKLAKGTNR